MKADFAFLLSHPAHFIALGFGSGLAPKAPGTFGSLAALPLFWLMTLANPHPVAIIVMTAAGFLIGVWACAVTGRHLGIADYGGIVWDEMVAMCLILALVPAEWVSWLVALALFRFFDILKPWPIRQFDARLKNGFGVMIDDILAALYTLAIFKGVQWLG